MSSATLFCHPLCYKGLHQVSSWHNPPNGQWLSSCHDSGKVSKVTEDEDALENASISCIPLNIKGSLPRQLSTTQTVISDCNLV